MRSPLHRVLRDERESPLSGTHHRSSIMCGSSELPCLPSGNLTPSFFGIPHGQHFPPGNHTYLRGSCSLRFCQPPKALLIHPVHSRPLRLLPLPLNVLLVFSPFPSQKGVALPLSKTFNPPPQGQPARPAPLCSLPRGSLQLPLPSSSQLGLPCYS